jgi:hypothetical protein
MKPSGEAISDEAVSRKNVDKKIKEKNLTRNAQGIVAFY